MTTFEHALLGVNGLLATGLQHRHGWTLVALAGVAAIAPDWDGIPMLWNMARFEHGHRVWGHSILSCVLLGVTLGSLDYHFDLVGNTGRFISRFGPLRELSKAAKTRRERSPHVWFAWVVVAIVSALSQIPADAVVSGADGLSDWALKPLWPFSDWELVYAMVPWGNVGVTIIFAVAMIAQVKHPKRVQAIAKLALLAVVVYIAVWGAFVH